jgi:hypothetical protein
MKIPTKNRGGDCYEAAGHYFLDHGAGNSSMHLIHGEVTGQGPIAGIKFGHAWIEDGEEVVDLANGKNLRMPKAIYYALGHIEKRIRYDYKTFLEKVLKTGNWGPWDLHTQY